MLACVLALGCAQTQARCVASVSKPGEAVPQKVLVKDALERSTAVFVGTVTAKEYIPVHAALTGDNSGEKHVLVIRLAASAWWKGEEDKQVTLYTTNYRFPEGETSIEAHEFDYEQGKTYLVFADTYEGALHANICTRTKLIEAAAEDVAFLDWVKGG